MAKEIKLNALKFGLAGGIITALCVFLSTLMGIVWPGYAAEYLNIFVSIYGPLMYKVSFAGSILGAVYGFIDGFVLTWIFAKLYNRFL